MYALRRARPLAVATAPSTRPSTRDGLRRRRQRGQPLGPIALVYRVEYDTDGTPRRIVDEDSAGTVRMVFDLVEQGHSPGSVQRELNALGLRGRRGAAFTARTVRDIIRNDAYAGMMGYSPIIDPERFDRINASIKRPDPTAIQRQQGGRPSDTSFLLRGVALCACCGSPLYTRRHAIGRVYLCKHRRLGTGTVPRTRRTGTRA